MAYGEGADPRTGTLRTGTTVRLTKSLSVYQQVIQPATLMEFYKLLLAQQFLTTH